MQDVLTIKTLKATLADHDRTFVLDVPELRVAASEVVALSGPSGTGKTCLLELVGLLRRPDAGASHRLSDGENTYTDIGPLWSRGARMQLSRLRGRALGFVPQSGGLLPFMTLRENIALSQQITLREDPQMVTTLAETLDLGDLLDLRPDQLSIGQRQRGAIARALAHRPALVIADEPTAALDPDTAETAMALIVDAARETGCAVLVSSHDLPLLTRHTHRAYRLALDHDRSAPGRIHSVLSEAMPEAVL